MIKIQNTHLTDSQNRIILFYHSSPSDNISSFVPLTHFGTATAAQKRSMFYYYQALHLPEPQILPDTFPEHFLLKLRQRHNEPKITTYTAQLYMKNPLRIPDLGKHSIENYFKWFSKEYKTKSKFLSTNEQLEKIGLGSQTQYKKQLTEFIFVHPYTQPITELKKELSSDHLFSIIPSRKNTNSYPIFLTPVIKRVANLSDADKTKFSYAEKVAYQRFIRFLESEGYDGFVYQNKWEDKGQDSYIIFRPEQVFLFPIKEKEHMVQKLTPNQSSYLQEIENNFFHKQNTLSPHERVLQSHLIKQKGKIRTK